MKTQYLQIPIEVGIAYFPIGISEEELEFIIETFRLWRPGLVKKAAPLPATLVGEHNGHTPDAGVHI